MAPHLPASEADAPASSASATRAVAIDAPAGLSVLPDDFDECVALYFDCETAEERDGFLRCLAARQGGDVDAFLLAMMAEDEDPFVRLQAATLLGARGIEAGRVAVAESLAVSSDDTLLAAAIDAWISLCGPAAADELASICRDAERTHSERRLAQVGLTRADLEVAATVFVELLEQTNTDTLDDESIENMLPALLGHADFAARACAALTARSQRSQGAMPELLVQVAQAPSEEARERAQDAVDAAREAQQNVAGALALLQAKL